MRTHDRLPNGVKNAKLPGPSGLLLHPSCSMARPYWTGQISLSLVSFAVEIYPAVDLCPRPSNSTRSTGRPGSAFTIKMLPPTVTRQTTRRGAGTAAYRRKGHEEDKHVVEKSDIVKGYEYEKGKYAIIEPEDLKRLRIPGKDTLEIAQFSPANE